MEGILMKPNSQVAPISKKARWAGRITSAVPAALLLFSGILKLMKPQPVLQGFIHYGYPERLTQVIGILEIACTIVYLIPRTSFLGAILMAAYLGGATASNVRVGDPSWVLTVILGVMVWVGLYFREGRLRALLPLRTELT
jgi:DoxX-like family